MSRASTSPPSSDATRPRAESAGGAPDRADPETWTFKLLYDSECPFCRWEVEWLKRRDRLGRLAVEDIAADGFDPDRYGIKPEDVHAKLHGVLPDGTITVGMESVRRSYAAAGVGWLMAWTRWPVLSWFADLGYVLFARYRVPLGRLFGRRCEGDTCSLPRR
jgi:predicted DCC family thiol-disulfide oxidoreductase YuxK